MQKKLRIAFLGDIVGKPGCAILQKWVPKLRQDYKLDAIVVNGENATNKGKGISPKIFRILKEVGVDIVTSGNHIWKKKEIFNVLKERDDITRPANYPPQCPGKGYAIFNTNNITVAIINLQGRIFMRENLDCPFRTADSLLTFLQPQADLIFVDFHAEATSEKKCLALYLDGRVSGVLGTHTHVQTADEQILPNGTAFITDLGCCGAVDSVIGDKLEQVLRLFLTQMPAKFQVEDRGPIQLSGVVIEADMQSGKSTKIKRICLVDDQIIVPPDTKK